MQFLLKPVAAFAQLKKRPVVSDALFIVASIWIVLLGIQLSQLASLDALTTALVIRSIAVITFGVAAVWFSVSGAGYLLTLAAGGKTNYAAVVTMTALAATPLALFGIVAIVVEMVGVIVGGSSDVLMWTTRSLLALALLVGAPGLYFALGLFALTKIRLATCLIIALFLLMCVVGGWLIFRGDVLQF